MPLCHAGRCAARRGSITEVRRGVWRIRYWAEGPDGYRRRSETVRGSRKDAVERRSALMLEHGDDAPCPTVGQCWERWYRPDLVRMVEEGERAEQTLGQYDSRWRCHVGPRWADVPADEVRPLAVQQWIDTMPHSVAPQAAQVLRATLSYAVRYEAIASNPLDADYVMPPKSTSRERSRETWDVPGLIALCLDARGEWYEAPLLLMSFGGARVAESLGVRAEEVELTRVPVGGVEVSVATAPLRQQVRGAGIVDERLKNRWSVRPAVMPGSAGERLAEIRALRRRGVALRRRRGRARRQVRPAPGVGRRKVARDARWDSNEESPRVVGDGAQVVPQAPSVGDRAARRPRPPLRRGGDRLPLRQAGRRRPRHGRRRCVRRAPDTGGGLPRAGRNQAGSARPSRVPNRRKCTEH